MRKKDSSVEVDHFNSSNHFISDSEVQEPSDAVYCLCRGPDDHSTMLQCQFCDEWFHARCVQLREDDIHVLNEFICPLCADGVDSDPEEKEIALTHKTKKNQKLNETQDGADANHISDNYQVKRPRKQSSSPKTAEPKHLKSTPINNSKESSSQVNTSSVTTIRKNVRDALVTAFQRLSQNEQSFSEQRVSQLAEDIEAAMFNAFCEESSIGKAIGQRYKSKYRSLLFNIRDVRNSCLRNALLTGDKKPVDFVQMSSEELAAPDLQQEMQEARKLALDEHILKEDQHDILFPSAHLRKPILGPDQVNVNNSEISEHKPELDSENNVIDNIYSLSLPLVSTTVIDKQSTDSIEQQNIVQSSFALNNNSIGDLPVVELAESTRFAKETNLSSPTGRHQSKVSPGSSPRSPEDSMPPSSSTGETLIEPASSKLDALLSTASSFSNMKAGYIAAKKEQLSSVPKLKSSISTLESPSSSAPNHNRPNKDTFDNVIHVYDNNASDNVINIGDDKPNLHRWSTTLVMPELDPVKVCAGQEASGYRPPGTHAPSLCAPKSGEKLYNWPASFGLGSFLTIHGRIEASRALNYLSQVKGSIHRSLVSIDLKYIYSNNDNDDSFHKLSSYLASRNRFGVLYSNSNTVFPDALRDDALLKDLYLVPQWTSGLDALFQSSPTASKEEISEPQNGLWLVGVVAPSKREDMTSHSNSHEIPQSSNSFRYHRISNTVKDPHLQDQKKRHIPQNGNIPASSQSSNPVSSSHGSDLSLPPELLSTLQTLSAALGQSPSQFA